MGFDLGLEKTWTIVCGGTGLFCHVCFLGLIPVPLVSYIGSALMYSHDGLCWLLCIAHRPLMLGLFPVIEIVGINLSVKKPYCNVM